MGSGQDQGTMLSLREKTGYGPGDMACSMVFNFMSSYLLYYYTDVAAIAVGAAGTIMSAARLIDAIANPVVGIRQQGLLTSISMFMVKLGSVFSGVISAFVLKSGGYIPDCPQTEKALRAIKTNFVFLPCAAALACMALFLFFRLEKEYPAIHEVLKKRHAEFR